MARLDRLFRPGHLGPEATGAALRRGRAPLGPDRDTMEGAERTGPLNTPSLFGRTIGCWWYNLSQVCCRPIPQVSVKRCPVESFRAQDVMIIGAAGATQTTGTAASRQQCLRGKLAGWDMFKISARKTCATSICHNHGTPPFGAVSSGRKPVLGRALDPVSARPWMPFTWKLWKWSGKMHRLKLNEPPSQRFSMHRLFHFHHF